MQENKLGLLSITNSESWPMIVRSVDLPYLNGVCIPPLTKAVVKVDFDSTYLKENNLKLRRIKSPGEAGEGLVYLDVMIVDADW